MQQLEQLIEDARNAVGICNSCRYCEGFCAVFPALEQRLDFTRGDLHYLANLCHNCSECYYACQYAPPHEFNVNLPVQLAAVRQTTYQTYAWPGVIARGFDQSGLLASLGFLLALVVLLETGGADRRPANARFEWPVLRHFPAWCTGHRFRAGRAVGCSRHGHGVSQFSTGCG
ncbi:tricarballylate utilization protein B [Advenella kashmirensis WT001]|uniref:Tricarballylate utilization protein B n=1 Tax=Advenella kashmirensis (strain DSM 17095 / LMG 22695 / WT001) TaxID=1036672 RepID=I3UEJ5_ADVKW|nr:tricarballylate utilization protein B [Advenella kashmirensis WT001]